MNNKILLRSLIISLLAFMFYSGHLRKVNNASVKVVEPKSSKVNKKQRKEPNIKTENETQSTSSDVKVEDKSNKSLTSTIEKSMGSGSFQVAVQDLNNPSKFSRLASNSSTHSGNGVMRLYILTAIYKKEQDKNLVKKNVKVKKSDRVKDEKLLQAGMEYSIAYLRQAMMQGNKTAANVLIRIAGKSSINQVAKQFGADDTSLTGSYNSLPLGKTTANDLDLVMKGLYQGKVLNRQYAQLVLGAMQGSRTQLTKNIAGTIYSIGDKNFASAIVQSGGHSYVISVWAESNSNFAKLGTNVNNWFAKNK